MTKIVKLRDNSSFYITDRQAESMFEAINSNPNLRMLRILTGFGYRYITPSSIISMQPGIGEDYKSEESVLNEQRRAIRQLKTQESARNLDTGGTIGLLEGDNSPEKLA